MVTILLHLTVKKGRKKKWLRFVRQVTESTRKVDGCTSYTYYQLKGSPQEYILFEQWPDANTLRAHVERLCKVYGPPAIVMDEATKANLPTPLTRVGLDLPAKFLKHLERLSVLRCNEIPL